MESERIRSLREEFQRICESPHQVIYEVNGPPIGLEIRFVNSGNNIECAGVLKVEQIGEKSVRVIGEWINQIGYRLLDEIVRQLEAASWNVECFPDGIDGAIDEEIFGFASPGEAIQYLSQFMHTTIDRKNLTYAIRVAEVKTHPNRGGDSSEFKKVQQARKILGL